MSGTATPPGGLSVAHFEALALDAGTWLWGAARGAFNQKATLSQIVVDAVIGMIPLVGDVTAARDLIAVSMRLCDDPKARADKWEWGLLAVLLFALIPVIGGAIKGVGRLLIQTGGVAAGLTGAARAAHLLQAARDAVAFLNRIGVGNAERWLLQLRFAEHQAALMRKAEELLATLDKTLDAAARRLSGSLTESLRDRILAVRYGLARVKVEISRRIPQAVKDLDDCLREIQAYIRSGGETTSRAIKHTATAGTRAVTYADEARLMEGAGWRKSARGGVERNDPTLRPNGTHPLYQREPGYPDVTGYRRNRQAPDIGTYGGAIRNRPLEAGEQIYRVFGPEGRTHGILVQATHAPGSSATRPAYWGIGTPPTSAKQWRNESAVLDEWNRDGYMIRGTVTNAGSVKACTGITAEQTGRTISGQYFSGGGRQAMIHFDASTYEQLLIAGRKAIETNTVMKFETIGISWEIRPTGWTDANGIHGYIDVIAAAAALVRLEAREKASKDDRIESMNDGR